MAPIFSEPCPSGAPDLSSSENRIARFSLPSLISTRGLSDANSPTNRSASAQAKRSRSPAHSESQSEIPIRAAVATGACRRSQPNAWSCMARSTSEMNIAPRDGSIALLDTTISASTSSSFIVLTLCGSMAHAGEEVVAKTK